MASVGRVFISAEQAAAHAGSFQKSGTDNDNPHRNVLAKGQEPAWTKNSVPVLLLCDGFVKW